MTKRVIIAEKPSVAMEIASVLGIRGRRDGYIEGETDIITWCVGHLIELAPMDAYDQRLKDWGNVSLLPFLPVQFRYLISERTREQFNVIKGLLHRPDVSEVVNACDAEREGELIFTLVYQMVGVSLPVKRLWLQALTHNSILTAFASLKPAEEYAGLRRAASARQRADWLVGMNATRAQTHVARAEGGDKVYSLGRVQTPTLALVVDRDQAIENFRPSSYFEIKANFVVRGGEAYTGWLFKGPNPTGAALVRYDRKEGADAICRRLVEESNTRPALVVSVARKEVTDHPPFLYDLTLLQRVADRRFGYPASRTLEIAQRLYERKLITYPRTSSQYLTTDQSTTINDVLAPISHTELYGEYARAVLAGGWKLTARHVADKKVSDHHAIIPTSIVPEHGTLKDDEAAVYDLIVRRFLAAFYPDAKDARSEVVTTFGGEHFLTRGTTELFPGWRLVDPPSADKRAIAEAGEEDDTENAVIPPLEPNTNVHPAAITPVPKQTRAPARFTPDTLLAAMKTAGTQVENADEQAAMRDSGLGTSATRASTIDKLLERGYIFTEKRFIRSTPVAREIITRLRKSNSVLASPALTGKWEMALLQIEAGEFQTADFNRLVAGLTTETVAQILSQLGGASNVGKSLSAFAAADSAIACPKCAAEKREGGFLRSRGSGAKKFLACSQQQTLCGYTSSAPKNKAQTEGIANRKCPTCGGVMRLSFGKEKGTPFMSCVKYPACTGTAWFDDGGGKKKGASKAAKKGASKQGAGGQPAGNRFHTKN